MREDSSRPGDIVDVTGLSLRDIGKIDGSSLAQALYSILGSDSETEPVASFSSRI